MAEHQLWLRSEKTADGGLQGYEYEEGKAAKMMRVSHVVMGQNCQAMILDNVEIQQMVWVTKTWRVKVMVRGAQSQVMFWID